jgi:hypothetical protein
MTGRQGDGEMGRRGDRETLKELKTRESKCGNIKMNICKIWVFRNMKVQKSKTF